VGTTLERRLKTTYWGDPALRIRTVIGVVALALGFFRLRYSDADRPLGWAVVAFGVYVIAAIEYNMYIARVYIVPQDEAHELAAGLAKTSQATILTLTGTTLGILTAFTADDLQPATKAAVVSLVAATLIQFNVQGSGARLLGTKARRAGLLGDLLADYLLAFGLICLAAALLTRTT